MGTWMHTSYVLFGLVGVPGWVPVGLICLGVVLFVASIFVPTRLSDGTLLGVSVLGVLLSIAGVAHVGGLFGWADTSESVREHLESEYQLELVDSERTFVESWVHGSVSDVGVAVAVPGDGEVLFKSDGTVDGDRFVDADGEQVDIETYYVLDEESVAERVGAMSVMDDPVVSFSQADLSGKLASMNSESVLASGLVDGEMVMAVVLVNEHGDVRDVRVGGVSLLKK